MLLVPWDNDGFVRYACCKLNTELTSYEVTTVYNGGTRNGLVAGSLSHDTWKSGIYIQASGNNTVNQIKCYSGVSSDLTRDIIPHGKVKGKVIRSAKMFLGFFDDWRVGMETFGHANTLIVPALTTWKKGTPIGWNSWGVLMEKITYNNLTEVATFLRNELYDRGYQNEQGNVIIDLDSFWAEGLPSDGLRKQFATECKQRGQIPGIYWGPFANWGGLDNSVEYTDNNYHFRECTIYANGSPQTLDGAYCLDPTHPAVKERITKMFAQFKEWGYEYVKLDFVNFAAVQADSYYDKNVTTAIQAYNQGFQHLLDAAGDMFISLSIAPMFPYQYGNSRRMSCDAWGTIGHTEYVMNALSYGWWTDQFYQFNDPDHVVLQREGESEGANRARLTSAAITGMLLMGDNFSTSYTERGNPTVSKERAIKLATNKGILDIARLGTSFMPVYGHKIVETTKAENLFMRHTDDCLYVACINYYSAIQAVTGSIPLDQLGITANEIESIEELWTGETRTLKNGELTYAVPACDARVYRIKKKTTAIVSPAGEKAGQPVAVSAKEGILTVTSRQPLNKVEIYNLQGRLLTSGVFAQETEVCMKISSLYSGIFLVKCYSKMQSVIVKKISI
jgi:alpha-galactosidase